MRAMGLDVGTKTIGVAITDELRIAGYPLQTLRRRSMEEDVNDLHALVQEYAVTDIVVGLPLLLSGAVGKRVAEARELVKALRDVLSAEIGLYEWDERFSTAAVERVLVKADVSRKRRKGVIDKQAAAYILQGWLDARAEAP